MEEEKLIQLAVEAGKLMLESGAETYRVEETINRICYAYGLRDNHSFVLPTGIMFSCTVKDGSTKSLIRRVKSRTVDLEIVSAINDLSRNAPHLTPEEFKNKLKEIKLIAPYSPYLIIFFSCLGAGFFTLLFGGNIKDFIISFFIGGVIKYIAITLSKYKINDFLSNAICSSIVALIALISVDISIGSNVDKIIIGAIMLLVPGLAITNAIRDTIAGDLVAGISRALEAFFIALSIAIGAGVVVQGWYYFIGGI